jgi:hypothetical protein
MTVSVTSNRLHGHRDKFGSGSEAMNTGGKLTGMPEPAVSTDRSLSYVVSILDELVVPS